jgi:Protein of unknown function (DUF2510)
MYYYGHGSWIALVIFGAVFAMRMLSSQRRRRGYGRAPVSRSPFPGAGFQGSAAGSVVPSRGPAGATFTGIAPGWLADPFAKHEQRYWSGTEWTEHVSDGGVPGTDPPPKATS